MPEIQHRKTSGRKGSYINGNKKDKKKTLESLEVRISILFLSLF